MSESDRPAKESDGDREGWGNLTEGGDQQEWSGKCFLLIKKGKRSIVPNAPVIVVDAIKIRRIRPVTVLS